MRRPILAVAALALIPLAAAAQEKSLRVFATEGQRPAKGTFQGKKVVASRAYTPSPGGAARFESFFVDDLEDGTRIVRGTHRIRGVEEHAKFVWTADPATKTYSIRRVDLSREEALAIIGPTKEAAAKGPREMESMEDPPNYCEDPTDDWCDEHCSGNWSAAVVVNDPVGADLAGANVSGSWGITGVQTCRWRENYFGSCWADPDTFIHTTWYVDACYRAWSTVRGDFHNDDWGFDNLRTYAHASVGIRRVDGLGTFVDWWVSASGETAGFLYGTMTESGSNNCF